MTQQQPTKCKQCIVDWERCGLRLQDCKKKFPISDMELEQILQMNENLPTDEMELIIRDLIVMDIRERNSGSCPAATPASETKERCPNNCKNADRFSDCRVKGSCINCSSFEFEYHLAEHDAVIRQEGYNNALDDLQKYYNELPEHEASCPFGTMNESDDCQKYEHCEACIFNRGIESLRSRTS